MKRPDIDRYQAVATASTPNLQEFCESGDWWIQAANADGSPTGEPVPCFDSCQARTMILEMVAYIRKLERWAGAAQEVIALGVTLMPLDQLNQWTAVRTVQETCPMDESEA